MSIDVAKLAEKVLIDPDEEDHRIGDRWVSSPRVILFLRHFG